MNNHTLMPSKLDIVYKILATTTPFTGTMADDYIRHVCEVSLTLPDSLLFCENLWHQQSGKYFPALIAIINIWPSDQIIGIQRIYLENGRLADIPNNKMNLGNQKGGAVRVGDKTSTILLAESMENMLIAYGLTNLWSWSAISDPGINNVKLPSHDIVKNIIICGESITPLYWAERALAKAIEAGYNAQYSSISKLTMEVLYV